MSFEFALKERFPTQIKQNLAAPQNRFLQGCLYPFSVNPKQFVQHPKDFCFFSWSMGASFAFNLFPSFGLSDSLVTSAVCLISNQFLPWPGAFSSTFTCCFSEDLIYISFFNFATASINFFYSFKSLNVPDTGQRHTLSSFGLGSGFH